MTLVIRGPADFHDSPGAPATAAHAPADRTAAPIPAPEDGAAATVARTRSRREALLVRFWIALTVLMVVLMLSVIYVRWLTVTEPTAAIVVYGDPSIDGANVYVRAADGREVLADPVTLDALNNFVTPVLLVPGSYTLGATFGGKTVREVKFHIGPYQGQAFFLTDEARRRAAAASADRAEPPRRAAPPAAARRATTNSVSRLATRTPVRLARRAP